MDLQTGTPCIMSVERPSFNENKIKGDAQNRRKNTLGILLEPLQRREISTALTIVTPQLPPGHDRLAIA